MVGLCRLCASLKKPSLLITITDQSNEICQKLKTCCQLHMQIHDNLPKSICQECLECLNISYKFYIKVQEAQETLEALFPSVTLETPVKETNATTAAVTTREEHRKPLKCMKKVDNSSSKIKIENDACTHKQAAADENSGNVFTISNVASMSEDNDNDGYLREVYNILGMRKDDLRNDEDHMVIYTENVNKELPPDEQLKQMDEGDVDHHIEVETLEQAQSDIEFDKVLIMETANEDEIELLQEEEDTVTDEKNEVHDIQIDVMDFQKDFSTLPHTLQLSSWKSFIYLCHNCDYKAKGFNELRAHAQRQHSVDDVNKLQYRCYDCQRVIVHYNAFLNHVRLRHHPALKLRCDACDKLCDDYQQCGNHRKGDCTEAKKFPQFLPCLLCCKSFHSANGLQTHIKQQHSVQDIKETFQCTVCNKEFAQKRSLKVHELTHTHKRELCCNFCDKKFYNKGNLETHLYTHVSDNLYKCHICQKSYKSNVILEKHQLLHTNVKPFKCDFCLRLFRTKIEQTTHERVHTGEMPLQCVHCEKRFRFRSALNAHLKVHSGVKAHACKFCPKTFIDMSNFKKHVRRKHSEDIRNKFIRSDSQESDSKDSVETVIRYKSQAISQKE